MDMNQVVSFLGMNITVDQLISSFGIVGGLIMSVLGVVITIDKVLDILKKRNPNREVNERLAKHDELLERDRLHLLEHDKDIKKLGDDMRDLIKKIGDSNHITLECLLVLLDNASGDANKEELREAKVKLQDYLLK